MYVHVRVRVTAQPATSFLESNSELCWGRAGLAHGLARPGTASSGADPGCDYVQGSPGGGGRSASVGAEPALRRGGGQKESGRIKKFLTVMKRLIPGV